MRRPAPTSSPQFDMQNLTEDGSYKGWPLYATADAPRRRGGPPHRQRTRGVAEGEPEMGNGLGTPRRRPGEQVRTELAADPAASSCADEIVDAARSSRQLTRSQSCD